MPRDLAFVPLSITNMQLMNVTFLRISGPPL